MARDKIGAREIEVNVPAGEPSVSTLEARLQLMEMVEKMAPRILQSLLRPFNAESFDSTWLKENNIPVENWFLLHRDRTELWTAKIPFPNKLDPDPRATPLMEFFRLMQATKTKLASARRRYKSRLRTIYRNPETHDEAALKELFPCVQALRAEKKNSSFVELLEDWGKANGLADDWCLDLALSALRSFVTRIDKLRFGWQSQRDDFDFYKYDWSTRMLMYSAWSDARIELSDSITKLMFAGARSISGTKFRFTWCWSTKPRKTEFTLTAFFPILTVTKEEFLRGTEEQFWRIFLHHFGPNPADLAGRSKEISDKFSQFQSDLATYVQTKIDQASGKVTRPLMKKDWHRDLSMTFQVQVLYKLPETVAKSFRIEEPALEMCVRKTLKILGLRQRRRSKKIGRPPGIKEGRPRRLTQRR